MDSVRGERLKRGHERITPSTSSRRRSISSWERSDSRHSRSSGSVLDGRTLKCQSFVIDRDPVEPRLPRVAVAIGQLLDLLRIRDLGVDLARDEVARAIRLEQLGHRRALARELLEDQQRGIVPESAQ